MRRRPRRLSTRLASCGAIALGLALTSWVGVSAGALHGFELRASDSVFPRDRFDERVAVVGIDAASIAERGPWPWPRSLQAELVDRLVADGARVVALDVVYAPASSDDDKLAAALRRTDAVVAQSAELRTASGHRLQQVVAGIDPVDAVARAATVGHASVTPDGADGLVRTVPLVVERGRSFIPAFSLAVLARDIGVDPIVTLRPHAVQIGDVAVPTDRAARLRVSYPPLPRVLRAADVLVGRTPRSAVAGKVVFVGVTDLSVGDRLLTPVDRGGALPGVLVHAAAYNTMARRTYLSTPSRGSVVALVLALALVTALAVQVLPLLLAAVAVVALGGAYLVAGFLSADGGHLVSFVYPILGLALAVPASGAVRYVFEVRHRRRVIRLFSQYVPEWVSSELVEGDRAAELAEGRSVRATVLFCDIRGFTPLTAALEPSQVRSLLDCYYDVLSRVVLEHGGTVLRYVGDEVYAVFGAPLESADHESTAVACALAIQDANVEVNGRLLADDLPAVAYGIGINTGNLISTVVGSDARRQYAVIGNAVNVGARLCALAGAGEIVVSGATFGALTGVEVQATTFSAELKGIEGMPMLHRLRKIGSDA